MRCHQLTCLVAVTVSFECAAHEELHSLALDVKDRQWNMDITKEVDVMRVCNVVDDERARHKLFVVVVVAVIVMSVTTACDSWSCASSLWSPSWLWSASASP